MSKLYQFIVGLLITSVALAGAAELPKSLVKMKTGECNFTVVQSDGVKAAKDIKISITPVDGKTSEALASTTTDKSGKCSLGVVEDGRFILAVNDIHVAILETAETSILDHYRLVLPSEGLIVGGQEPAPAAPADEDLEEGGDDGDEVAGFDPKKKKIFAAAVIAGAIILIAQDDDDDDAVTPGAVTTTQSGNPLLDQARVPDDVRAAFRNANSSLQRAILKDIDSGGSGRAPIQRLNVSPARAPAKVSN